MLDASNSPLKERYATSKYNISKLIQLGNIDDRSPKRAQWARLASSRSGQRREIRSTSNWSSVEARIVELRAKGNGILKIGKTLGIGTSVVQRVFKEVPWKPRSP